MLFPNVGIKRKARREHHLVFASHIKALSSLYFDVSVGGGKKDSFGGISNSGFLPASLSTLMCLKQTNNFLSVFSGSVYSVLLLSKYPKGAKTTRDFLDKCQLRCSKKWQPAIQPAVYSASQPVWKGVPGASCLNAAHITSNDVWCFEM